MKRFVSIRKKLITNTMVTISLIFAVVLSVIIIKDIRAVNKSIKKSEHNIRNSIIAKGSTLFCSSAVWLATELGRLPSSMSFPLTTPSSGARLFWK